VGLFIYLAVTGQPYSRDSLATLFWPDNDQSSARANLRRDISRLKKSIGENSLLLDGDNVSWNPDFDLWLDLKEFQAKLDAAASHGHPAGTLCPGCSTTLTDAVKLYSDDFLAGFSLPDSSEFDDWQFFQAEGLRRSLAEALQKLVDWHTANGDFEQAISYARRWLALDSLHEPAHQALMRLYAWAGEQASAIRQYKECARLLREKLKLEPDGDTRALYEAIQAKRLSPPEKATIEERSVAIKPVLQSSPSDVTPFIGREKEISALVDKLKRADARLMTIVALGGTGKTRLSVEAAKRFLQEHPAITPDGAVFIALASVDTPDALPYAIAKDLGLSLSGQLDPLSELVNSLRKRRMLLVLDNFEQLVEGAPMLQELLSACPGIKMLVTSREPLHLSFEWRVDLGGLLYPETDTTDADKLESVRLFLQSAEQVKPGFELTQESRPLVYRLCARLAGMPLAIKLAANWLRVMSLGQIVAEVERSLDILTGQMRDIPDRQRSMNAVFESTWEMLSSEEQRAFASIAVFRGGFSAQAAQQVAEVSPYLLAGLVDHGLVRLGNEGRYEVHELTRQFAATKLRENEATNTFVPEKHSYYYLDFVIRECSNLYGQAPQASLAILKKDLANIRYAWDWAVEHWPLAELEPAVEPLAAFYEIAGFLVAGEQAFWMALEKHKRTSMDSVEQSTLFTLLMHYALFLIFEGRWMEAIQYAENLEEIANSMEDGLKIADANQIMGLIFHYSGKKAETVEPFKKAIETYRTLSQPRSLIYALNHLGEGYSSTGKPKEALGCHEEALKISQEIGDSRMGALSLSHMGVAHFYNNELDSAVQFWEQAAHAFELLGDVRDNGRTRNNLSYVFNLLGEYDRAVQNGEKALAIMVQIGDRLNEANTSDTLGEAYFALGDYPKARQHFENAIQLSRELGHEGSDPASYRTNLALLELAMGRYAKAEEQLGQASSFHGGEGHPKEIANFLSVTACLYERTDRKGEALEAIDQGISLLQDADDQLQAVELLVQKASLLLADGKTAQAESSLNYALQSMQEQNIPPVLFEAQLLSARLLHAKGKTKEANQRLKDLHNTRGTDAQHAALHYLLWQIDRKEEHARVAYELYHTLYRKTPNIEYQERLQELQVGRKKEKSAPGKDA
jgi:predicted ATPase/DNA-binding SARP family transcriptional activator